MCFESVKQEIKKNNKTWLITGGAGFIGSHLIENLLHLNQKVVAIDNFSVGLKDNLKAVEASVGSKRYHDNLQFIEGDIRDYETCHNTCVGVDYVLHQAALSSVEQSLECPLTTHDSNVTGTLNLMWACVKSGVKRFVYASSSSVYGDDPGLPNKEEQLGIQLSPYAIGKYTCELYARSFYDIYQLETIGLRYFNIYGPRQNDNGPYAAVIPCFARHMASGRPIQIYGDGKSSRDFCFVDDVVQANLLSATTDSMECFGRALNVSSGEHISIFELYKLTRDYINDKYPDLEVPEAEYNDFRKGEIRHSLGDISKIETLMGYKSSRLIGDGLSITLDWYLRELEL